MLADLGDPPARETLIQVALLPAAGCTSRSLAAEALAERRDPHAADVLVEQLEYRTITFGNLPAGVREIQARVDACSDATMRDKALALLRRLDDPRAGAHEPTAG